jgi:hypothetical protein
MKKSKTDRKTNAISLVFIYIGFLLLLPVSAYSNTTEINVKFKPGYKIKRVPNVGVTIYNVNTEEQIEEYFFKDFNADVVLQIYRRVSVDQITSNLAKKYYLSKEASRRGVKRVINVLEEWGMVTE